MDGLPVDYLLGIILIAIGVYGIAKRDLTINLRYSREYGVGFKGGSALIVGLIFVFLGIVLLREIAASAIAILSR